MLIETYFNNSLPLSFLAYYLDNLSKKENFLFICSDDELAFSLSKIIKEINYSNNLIFYLPSLNLEKDYSPSINIQAERILTLYNLINKKASVICSYNLLREKFPPFEYIIENSYKLIKNSNINTDELCQKLVISGYTREDLAQELGSFSLRGNILDIYTISDAYRIELIGDFIEKIKVFDPQKQKSVKEIDTAIISPVRELSINNTNISFLKENFKNYLDSNSTPKAKRVEIISYLENNYYFPGIENYINLFYSNLNTVFDYLDANTLVYKLDSLLFQIDSLVEENLKKFTFKKEYSTILSDSSIKTFQDFKIKIIKAKDKHDLIASIIKQNHQDLLKQNYTIIYCLKNINQASKIKFLLEEIDANISIIEIAHLDFLNIKENLITVKNIKNGFIIEKIKLAVIAEEDIFNSKKELTYETKDKENIFTNVFKTLNINDYVVHKVHGIGIYKGLIKLNIDKIENDFFEIQYLNNDKLFVPIYKLNNVQKYLAADNLNIRIDKLGSSNFYKRKLKAKESSYKLASELIQIQSKRNALLGYSFSPNNEIYEAFENEFEFEETQDQKKAIQAVIQDMQLSKPMDRLICGDVGFGKTEIAMRASFKATLDNKQTCVLVPTTLLAYQHYRIFTERMRNYPVKIEFISRFKNKHEQKDIIKKLENGSIDVIIGTHRVLSNDIKFKDLGLLVVDEEHRFGVKQKEKIKKLSYNVDILTLTATPIPRTLNNSLLGLKEISLIASPPINRLAIKTYISKYSSTLIRKAILYELKRKGQIFFLNNKVQDIDELFIKLKEIVPEARINYAHGQMKAEELEKIMLSFYKYEFDILLCTTIIESGIDIPNVNTIIINKADNFGLSQLYQIRGRVGRSFKQAYCYLLLPENFQISKKAIERLKILEKFNQLGSGFNIASYDLEFRGAGELLGSSQSGFINSIGLEEYLEMIESSIKELKGEKEETNNKDIEININLPAFIPNKYINNTSHRLFFYKKISEAKTAIDLTEIKNDLLDRYGKIPEELNNLFYIVKIKQHLEPFNVKQVKIGETKLILELDNTCKFDPNKIIELVKNPKYSLNPDMKFICNIDDKHENNVIKEIEKIVELLR